MIEKADEGRAPPRTPKWERPETFEEMSKLIGELLGDESAARVDDRLLAAIEWYADTRVMAAEESAEQRSTKKAAQIARSRADRIASESWPVSAVNELRGLATMLERMAGVGEPPPRVAP